VVAAAARASSAGALSEPQREAAHAAAHKLAGSLGTFGLHRGTELARQAECVFAGENAASASELSGWVTELRQLIDSRK